MCTWVEGHGFQEEKTNKSNSLGKRRRNFVRDIEQLTTQESID